MRGWNTCKHYWKVIGPWVDAHAIAKCLHCYSYTTVDRDGLGPCAHSMGQRIGEQYFHGESPLEKELPEVAYDDLCANCKAIMDEHPGEDVELPPCQACGTV